MKKQLHAFYLFVFVQLIFPLFVSAQIISKEPKDLFVLGNESITFRSATNNKDYKLYVNLPENYAKDLTKIYPVFYTLDGQWDFPMATSVYGGIRADGFVPEMIIIGVSYADEKPDYNLLRGEDLTPTNAMAIKPSGGAQKFLSVLSDEIIPMIDRLYRTDKTNRTLIGTSLGGLFAHYVLFTQPTLFNGYLINNASFWWDNDFSFKLENEFYQNNNSINAKVMIASGEHDFDLQNANRMVEQIKKHQYKNLTLNFWIVKGMLHSGGNTEATAKAMGVIYKRPTIMLPDNELKEFTGTYQTDDASFKTITGTNVFEIVIKDGELTWIDNHIPEGEKLHAISKSEFSHLGQYLDFHFNRDSNGKVSGLFCQFLTYFSLSAVKIK